MASGQTSSVSGTEPAVPPPPAPGASSAGFGPGSAADGAARTIGYGAQPAQSRVANHVRTLGILWIVVSAFRLMPALFMLGLGHMDAARFSFVPSPFRFFMMPLMGSIGFALSATALIGLAAGWGLLDRRPWARMLAIVMACLALVSFPFGTALGIYTLWVLAGQGSEVEYQRIARA